MQPQRAQRGELDLPPVQFSVELVFLLRANRVDDSELAITLTVLLDVDKAVAYTPFQTVEVSDETDRLFHLLHPWSRGRPAERPRPEPLPLCRGTRHSNRERRHL